jgi:hypothetical protein
MGNAAGTRVKWWTRVVLACTAGLMLGMMTRCDGQMMPVHAATVQTTALPTASYGTNAGNALPDAKVTPGAVDPRAMADISGKPHIIDGVERNVCAADFRTKPIRATIRDFAGIKKKACREYGVAQCDKSVEGDHLVSLEIGGCPDCLTNIWPQPMDQARVKDHQVEDVLPKLVCAGRMSLTDAQACVAKDWVACAARIGMLEGAKKGKIR